MKSFYKKLKRFWCHVYSLKISPYHKLGTFYSLFLLSIVAGLSPWLESAEYQDSLYDTLQNLVPLWVLAEFWLITAFFVIGFLFTKRYVYYLMANLFVLFLSLIWTLTLLYAKFFEGESIITTIIALWVVIVSNALYNLLSKVILENCPESKNNEVN